MRQDEASTGDSEGERMTITAGETTTEVHIKAFTTLRPEDFTTEVEGRPARIREATVYWEFEDGQWRISFVQLDGAHLKKNGAESRRALSTSSEPADGTEDRYGLTTPQVIVEAALAHTPDWQPQMNESGYASREQSDRRHDDTAPPGHDGPSPARSEPHPAPAGITHVETTTQVLVHAYTALQLEDFPMQVKARTAKISKAEIRWDYQDRAWHVGAVRVWGPAIRQKDGTESSQHISELTRPADASNSRYGVITPPEIIEVALQNVPDWEPQITGTHIPRIPTLRTSL